MDLSSYRNETEAFMAAVNREHYLHFSGQQPGYEVDVLYQRHGGLFARETVDSLRSQDAPALAEFAAEGLIGRETARDSEELARREASLELTVDGETLPFRAAAVAQARANDPERRDALQDARDELTTAELDPVMRRALERSHELARDLGYESMLALCESLSGIDLGELAAQAESFLVATDARYEAIVGPQLEAQLGLGLDGLRRADLPAFFRAPALDAGFPAERLLPSLRETLAGLGINLDAQGSVHVDAEERPTKSPRAFCAPVTVPDDIYLVISPSGGREDFAALFHEAGHAEHFAHMDAGLPAEQRLLGDNSITEMFAFLLEHLIEDAEWLRRRLPEVDAGAVAEHARATRLLFLRRYAAKLLYELELQADPDLDSMPARYSELLSRAVRVDWPAASWLSDVDPFFYAARYLRAWAAEAALRRQLQEGFGPAWFEEPEAGDYLRELWREGQRANADELLGDLSPSGRIELAILAPS